MISRFRLTISIISLLTLLAGCAGEKTPSGQAVVKTETLSTGSTQCPDGGVSIDTGIDQNGNGLLESDEVDNTVYVCNGTSGANGIDAIVKTTIESPGINCATGGIRIDSGLDTNGNIILDASEVTSTSYVCNGPEIDSGLYPTLEDADAAATAAGKELNITQNYNISTDTTLMADIIIAGGSFTKSGSGTLVHAGRVSNPANKQCYFGFDAGDVTGLNEARPEWFGAQGNGSNYDGAAIASAIAATPPGGKIILSPGKNYVVEQMLDLYSKTLSGYGASISRPTITVDIPVISEILADSARTINVRVSTNHADYSKIRVGMSMTFINNPGEARKVDFLHRKITAISSGMITLTGGDLATIASPANTVHMVNLYPLIMTGGSAIVEGLTIEGNKSYYSPERAYWEIGMSITSGYNPKNCIIRECIFNNSLADGIMIGGQTMVQNNMFFFSGGGGVHLSGTVGAKIIGNYIFDSNLNLSTGHNEAAIIYSAAVYDTLIADNVLDTCLNGIGSINSSWNEKAIISNNSIRNFRENGIYFGSIPQVGMTNVTKNFVIVGNRFVGSNREKEMTETSYSYVPTSAVTKATGYGIYVKEWSNPGPNLYQDVSISGNSFQDCGVSIQNTESFSLTGNSFVDMETYAAYESTPAEVIRITDSAGTISGNSIVSYPTGTWRQRVFTFDSGGLYASNVMVSGNSISTQLPCYNLDLSFGINLIFQPMPADIYNIAANSDFSLGDVLWFKNTGWTIVDQGGGVYKAVATGATAYASLYQAMPMESGRSYKLTFTVSDYTSGILYGSQNSQPVTPMVTGPGTYSGIFVSSGNAMIGVTVDGPTSATISNISLIQLPAL